MHLHSVQNPQHMQRSNCMHIYCQASNFFIETCLHFNNPQEYWENKPNNRFSSPVVTAVVILYFCCIFFFCYHTFFALRFNLAQMQAFLIIALSWQNLPHFKITSWCRQCDDNFRFQGQLTSLLPGFHCALVIAQLLGDECYPPFSIPQTHNGLGRTFTFMT